MTVVTATGPQWPPTTSAPGVSSGSGSPSHDQSSQPSTTTAQASPPFFSPATHVDPSTGIAVLAVLDHDGKIIEQLPSQQVVDEYKRHQGPDAPVKSSSADHSVSGQASSGQPITVHTADASGQGNTGASGQDQGNSTSQH